MYLSFIAWSELLLEIQISSFTSGSLSLLFHKLHNFLESEHFPQESYQTSRSFVHLFYLKSFSPLVQKNCRLVPLYFIILTTNCNHEKIFFSLFYSFFYFILYCFLIPVCNVMRYTLYVMNLTFSRKLNL